MRVVRAAKRQPPVQYCLRHLGGDIAIERNGDLDSLQKAAGDGVGQGPDDSYAAEVFRAGTRQVTH